MDVEIGLKQVQKMWHGSLRSYLIGFFACLLLTSLSFALVIGRVFSDDFLKVSIAALALVQAVFQLLYFLHLGKEGKPHWETCIFFFMFLILMIIAGGTLWIMHDLKMRTMTQPAVKVYEENPDK